MAVNRYVLTATVTVAAEHSRGGGSWRAGHRSSTREPGNAGDDRGPLWPVTYQRLGQVIRAGPGWSGVRPISGRATCAPTSRARTTSATSPGWRTLTGGGT